MPAVLPHDHESLARNPVRPSWLMQVAWLAEMLPALVGVAMGRAHSPARRWTMVWCLLLALQDAVLLTTAVWGSSNLFLSYIFMPMSGTVILWALAWWQVGARDRRATRLAIPVFVVVMVILSLLVDHPTTFSQVTAPYYALVLLVVSSWTFVRRSLASHGSPLGQDWFWALTGLLLYFGASTAIQPLTSLLLNAGRLDLIDAAFNLRAGVFLISFVVITVGMVRPLPPDCEPRMASPPARLDTPAPGSGAGS